MKYILLLAWVYHGAPANMAVEFNSKDACEFARAQFDKPLSTFALQSAASCVPKGSEWRWPFG